MRSFLKSTRAQGPVLTWETARDALLILAGAFLQATALRIFLVPALLASGGVSGIAAETTSQGSSVLRTAMIVTSHPEEVTREILHRLGRGVTLMLARGGYTGQERVVIYCVVTRAEVAMLKAVVREADQNSFMVIGQANEALGEGFQPFD